MKLVKIAVKRPVMISILVGVLLILGYVSFSRLGVDLYPDMKFPVGAVITNYAGAGPEEVESQITRPLESVVGTVANVQEISSYSLAGMSAVIVMFNWGTDMDFAALDVREKIALIEPYLPQDAEKPMVVKMDPSLMPVMQIGLTGGQDLGQLQSMAEDEIQPALERVPGVASVTLTGGLTREVRVDVDPAKLQNYGLSMSQLAAVLMADNFNQTGGVVKSGDRQYYVRSLQEFESVDDIRNVSVFTATGDIIKLSDVAQITDGFKDEEQKTRMNAKPSMGIHIMKQSDANTVKVSADVKAELARLQEELPGGIEVATVFDQADFINDTIDTIQTHMLEGALLAILILFLFLRSVPSTLVIATSIPLSIVATFMLMYFFDMSINLITLGGIALGIGRIVDDSIVVLENIFRHRVAGESPLEAAINGATEVGDAVMAATFTTVAVFLPIFFVTEGIASILFKPLAITVSFAILASLVVALTIVPLLSSRMMTGQIVHEVKEEGKGVKRWANRFAILIDGLGERYRKVIEWSLSHRRIVVGSVTALMIASLALIPVVGAEFMPRSDAGQMSIRIEMDKGSVLEETDRVTRQVEELIKESPEVKTVFTSVGSSGQMMSMASGTDNSTIMVMLSGRSERNRSTAEIAEEIREKLNAIPGAKITVSEYDPMTAGMQSEAPVAVKIAGDDLDELWRLSNEVADIVREVPGTQEVESSLTEGTPEVQIQVDRAKAAAYGLTPGQVATSLQSAVQGTVATRYRVQGDEVDVRIRYDAGYREHLDDLGTIMISSPTGVQVPLGQLARIVVEAGPMAISRIDQVRVAQVTAKLSGRDLASVIEDVQAELSQFPLPTGYSIEYVGENKEMVESFQSLALALLLAIVLVYAVMAIQYESFFIPFVIMFSVPTCFIGVVGGLALTGRTLNVVSFIGVIMLVGIAVSNAIVLVDYIKKLQDRGMERNQAVAQGGAVRLRPVLMTALATILALFPLSLGLGEGGEMTAPLATVVIGGLLVSTIITLVLVPVVYTIFDDWGIRFRERLARRKSRTADLEV
ncbi:MAG: efflux RND transporter permease subunit [Syntrophomonadales bacterium]|jgi:HAE1 family hydrophobic/amphiphilic exporter-1